MKQRDWVKKPPKKGMTMDGRGKGEREDQGNVIE